MKVTVNQQVITRPEVLKPIKPGFQNYGKDVEINNIGQLVRQDAEAKELKKAFGLENAFKDIGYQNIGQNAKDEGIEDDFGFKKEGLNIEKDSVFKNVNVFKDIVLQDVGQKGGSVSAGERAEAGPINTLA
ncbi:MAG: hypothetical protein ACE5GU_11640 [Candidatus Scalinduaceae bacterium]